MLKRKRSCKSEVRSEAVSEDYSYATTTASRARKGLKCITTGGEIGARSFVTTSL
jgi:hypothetical protein